MVLILVIRWLRSGASQTDSILDQAAADACRLKNTVVEHRSKFSARSLIIIVCIPTTMANEMTVEDIQREIFETLTVNGITPSQEVAQLRFFDVWGIRYVSLLPPHTYLTPLEVHTNRCTYH